jgi:hypothetical protein
MNRQTIIGIGAILAILASAWLITRNLRRQPETIGASLSHAVSAAAVQQVTSLLHGRGNIVVFAAADCDECNLSRELRETFAASLKSASGIHVLATELVRIPSDGNPQLPADIYRRVQQQHPGADAIVSLVGAPSVDRREFSGRSGKLIVVLTAGDGEPLRELIAGRIIAAAIIPRIHPPAGIPRPPKTLQQIFDFNYELLKSS